MKKNKYWFTQKRYGYGVVPISWEGWLMTVAFLIFLLGISQFLFRSELFAKEIGGVVFIIFAVLGAFFFLYIIRDHQKGKLKWRWGEKD